MTRFAETVALAGHVLPPDGPLRDHTREPADRSAHYLDRFDRRTLWYECADLGGRTLFTAPRMLNLWPEFRDGLSTRDGGRPRLRRQGLARSEMIEVAAPPDALVWRGTALAARPGLARHFAGASALVCINWDNDAGWIVDWARFHATRHGANALVLFDNASTAYTPEELAAAVAFRTPLRKILVARAPDPDLAAFVAEAFPPREGVDG